MTSTAALALVAIIAADDAGTAEEAPVAIGWAEAGCVLGGKRGEVLDCSSQKTRAALRAIPYGLPASIEHLWLSKNKISKIRAEDLVGAPKLKYLYIDDNLLTAIDASAFGANPQLSSVSSLRLTPLANFLERCAAYDKFTPHFLYRHILLDHNALTELPHGLLKGLANLKTLDVRHNALTVLHAKAVQGASNLNHLNLFGNSIEDIGCGTFNELPMMTYLNLGEVRQCSVLRWRETVLMPF